MYLKICVNELRLLLIISVPNNHFNFNMHIYSLTILLGFTRQGVNHELEAYGQASVHLHFVLNNFQI